jgi:hypothetical protein
MLDYVDPAPVSDLDSTSKSKLIQISPKQLFPKQAPCYHFLATTLCRPLRLGKGGNDTVHPLLHRLRHLVLLHAMLARSTNAHSANNRSDENQIGSDMSKPYTCHKKNGYVHLTSRCSYRSQEYLFVHFASRKTPMERIYKTYTTTKSASINRLSRKHSTGKINYSSMSLKSINSHR